MFLNLPETKLLNMIKTWTITGADNKSVQINLLKLMIFVYCATVEVCNSKITNEVGVWGKYPVTLSVLVMFFSH